MSIPREDGGNPEMVEFIARLRHLCWTCFQMGAGQPYNPDPTPDQLESLKNGVEFLLLNPVVSVETNHENWMRMKLSQGWKYGSVKDLAAKTHPDLVPFDQLPEIEQKKDFMDIMTTHYGRKLYNFLRLLKGALD